MRTQINDGGPAFPCINPHNPDKTASAFGMTLRDWFAGQALAGVLANSKLLLDIDKTDPVRSTRFVAATYAYGVADAMLSERDANK